MSNTPPEGTGLNCGPLSVTRPRIYILILWVAELSELAEEVGLRENAAPTQFTYPDEVPYQARRVPHALAVAGTEVDALLLTSTRGGAVGIGPIAQSEVACYRHAHAAVERWAEAYARVVDVKYGGVVARDILAGLVLEYIGIVGHLNPDVALQAQDMDGKGGEVADILPIAIEGDYGIKNQVVCTLHSHASSKDGIAQKLMVPSL
jgi:hypothetical protein